MSKHAKKEDVIPDVDAPKPIDVDDIVKIAETFPSYRGEKGRVTRVRMDPVGGEFPVADVELLTVKQPVSGEPIWFSNIPLSQLVKVEE